MAHPAATGLLSLLPMASQLAHGGPEHHPVGPLPTVVDLEVALGDLAVPSDSEAELEAGALAWVVHLAAETGALVLSAKEIPGQAVHGQSGGTETSAQLLTGQAGLAEAGLPAHHGQLGLLALLQSLLAPSTLPIPPLSVPALLTPPPASATRLLRLPPPAPLRRTLAPPAVLLQSPLQVVRLLRRLWDSLPCYKGTDRSVFCNKIMY